MIMNFLKEFHMRLPHLEGKLVVSAGFDGDKEHIGVNYWEPLDIAYSLYLDEEDKKIPLNELLETCVSIIQQRLKTDGWL